MFFRFIRIWFRSRRADKAQARAIVRRRLLQSAADRPGPPAVALARSRFADQADIAIDPLETECRAHPRGFETRAWVLVPHSEIPARLSDSLAPSIAKLSPLSPIVRQIFFLATAYSVTIGDIATLLGMPRRDVRRAMLAAIASLDSKTVDNTADDDGTKESARE